MTLRSERYERRGTLAINPKAFFELFLLDDAPRENSEIGDAVIVDIRGPLEQHAHPFFDSYEAIAGRVALACESPARAVILRFDSPGGDVAGCFDTAVQLREQCARGGKELHALVDGDACSAAYALACSASSITVTNASLVGSIGVLSCREDVSAMNASRGVRVELITSGARKGDGHPDRPITEAELAQTQSIVDSMAGVFFDLVARARGMSADAISQLEARTFHGPAAVEASLADEVGTLSTVLAIIAGERGPMKSDYEEARALLEKAAKGNDANSRAAKRALAALDEGKEEDKDKESAEAPDEDKDKDKDKCAEAPDEDKEKKSAEAPDEKKDEDKEEPKAAAAMRIALQAQTETRKLRAELAARDEASERAELLSPRGDLSAEMTALLRKAPIELVRETIAGLGPAPKGTMKLGTKASAAPTRGEGQGDGDVSRLPPDEKRRLDERMGLVATTSGVKNTAYKLTLGALSPVEPKSE